jgi:chromodomain-helicase-DNA-binding protein 4
MFNQKLFPRCMQHPYLVDSSIERTGLSDSEAHKQLVDTSAKMRLLKSMLPKLKARGHRVLLFSQVWNTRDIVAFTVNPLATQFVIALNIIEDFLVGEGYKFLRLVRISNS